MKARHFRRAGQRGSEVVEFGLVSLPLLAFVFLILDACWVLFAQATLSNAARMGVRYAITSQTQTGLGQDASIRSVVQQQAMGFLPSATLASQVTIQYYTPDSLTPTNSNGGGNLVTICINNVQVTPMAPLLRSRSAITLQACSSDVMSASPDGVAPAR